MDPTASDEQSSDLAAAVAAVRRRPEPPALPRASLAVDIKTSPRLRRLLPTWLVVRRATRRGRALWRRSPAARDDALAAMTTIMGEGLPPEQLAALAEQHLIEVEVDRALFWQPWARVRLDRRSREHLRHALASGRGVLVSGCHLGPIGPGHEAVCSAERPVYSTAAPWFFEEPSDDYWGRRLAHWKRELHSRNQRTLPSPKSFAVLRTLLAEGEVVLVQFDMPGNHDTAFLGKRVMLTMGTARLAAQTGALVLPIRNRRERARIWADIAAPLDPRDFATEGELHQALASLHSRWILEQPATLEDPRRRGAWEAGATAEAWSRPAR